MRSFALMAFAGLALSLSSSGSFAQQPPANSPIDCGNPQNATTAFCTNRGATVPMSGVPAGGTGGANVTGSVNQSGQPSGGSAIDCGNPQNAITAYCTNRTR